MKGLWCSCSGPTRVGSAGINSPNPQKISFFFSLSLSSSLGSLSSLISLKNIHVVLHEHMNAGGGPPPGPDSGVLSHRDVRFPAVSPPCRIPKITQKIPN
ncbi:hypothetical protein L195_g037674 [Trifolium pratense]|uniref:Uncharacterized protein n=1 Tax=Trifolium pratense TaxID=57577 RepID=A0A2K3KXM0_TRIPR|nr:hypothetical protein L195_g057987 [Trifolium pratense]PNX79896.1 hypothetical protein L195_g035886 [Trifolium pratense]PNX81650.1 hypothetical protein L195_g037674 [Trifolium pratense]